MKLKFVENRLIQKMENGFEKEKTAINSRNFFLIFSLEVFGQMVTEFHITLFIVKLTDLCSFLTREVNWKLRLEMNHFETMKPLVSFDFFIFLSKNANIFFKSRYNMKTLTSGFFLLI